MTPAIRPATQQDATVMACLLEQLSRRYVTAEFDEAAEASFLASNDAAAIAGFMASGFHYWVAEEDEQLVGFVGVRDHSHLYHLFVAERVQRQGLARALWQVAMTACLAAGNPGRFTVNSSNHAVAVYEALGFVRSGPPQNADGILFNPMVFERVADR